MTDSIEPTFWENPEGVKLACYEWLPSSEPSFILYIVHGYADWATAYPKVVSRIIDMGGGICAHEHFAHGKSGPYEKTNPNRCQISSLDNTARDVYLRVEETKKKYPNLKIILYGHSLGGLISTLSVQEYPVTISGLILEAPAFKIHEDSAKWYLVLGAKILNYVAPKMKVGKAEFRYISRNLDVNKEKERLNPEYGDNGGMMAGVAVHMLTVQDRVVKKLNSIELKTLICSGTEDKLTAFSGSEFAHSKIPNSTLKVYQGAYHSLHDELPETTEEYLNDIQNFISALL